jgi:hypothetical protein
MNLNSKCSALVNVQLEIFAKMEADLKAQFLEVLELRERLRQAELWADLQRTTRDRSPAWIDGDDWP